MNAAESSQVLRRMESTWPRGEKLGDGVYEEWLTFLSEYDCRLAFEALRSLRDVCTWRPSMADFRSAYFQALAVADSQRKQLPAGSHDDTDSLRDRYGSDQGRWVYCWRCDMAVSLDELEGRIGYDMSRGIYHRSCPRHGSAPQIPALERATRDKWFLDHKVQIGPNVEPVPYIEVPRRTLRQEHRSQQVRDLASEAVQRLNGGKR